MKKVAQFIVIMVLACSSAKAQYRLMGSFSSDGKPNYLVIPGDNLTQSFRDDITATLPEYRSVPLYNPRLIADGRTETLNTNCNTDIWVTFVDEGASFLNVLGYYTYPTNAPLTAAPSPSQITIIFPNASKSGSGGSLNPGDKVYLGNFPPNTSIGFVLLADGWNGNANQIGASAKWVLYSDSKFNPETDPSLRKHTVLLHDTATNRIVIGFEDVRRDSGSDQDFNDVLFYVTANPLNCIQKLDSIPDLTPDGHISFSGYAGGLESKSIGDALSKRIYNKTMNSTLGDINYAKAPQLNTGSGNIRELGAGANVTAGGLKLSNVVPKNLPDPGYVAYLSTPADITAITNAIDVYAVDFTKNNNCRATVFATTTVNEVYSHTKAVCDRLKDARLLNIDSITINKLNYLTYTLQQANGNIEYVTSFSIGKSAKRNTYSFQSNWLLNDYATEDTLYNFQVWGAAPYYCIDLALNIIANFTAVQPVQQIKPNAPLPNIYITSGKRNGLNIDLTVKNNTSLTSGYFVLADKKNESSNVLLKRTIPFSINANGTTTISIPEKDVLESSIYLYSNNQLKDMLFTSDGSWGIDYNHAALDNRSFIVSNDSMVDYDMQNEFPLFRNIKAGATFSDYIGIYKLLQGGAVAKDLTDFKNLLFTASGNNTVLTVYLVKNSITDFAKQYSYSVPLGKDNKNYIVSLNNFKAAGTADNINPNDIVEIIFAIQTPDGKTANVNVAISNVFFSKKDAGAYAGNANNNIHDIQVYPNPSHGNVTISFKADNDGLFTYKLIESGTGRIMGTKTITAGKGINNVPAFIDGNGLHQYFIVLEGADGTKYTTKQIMVSH